MRTDDFDWYSLYEDEDENGGCAQNLLGVIVVFIILCVCVMLGGCKTRTVVVTVPEVRTDTTYITKAQRDSIWLHDSIYVGEKQKGDTIYMWKERWHTKYIEKATHDTIYQATHDTITEVMPIEVPKEVPARLSWWQKMLMWAGGIAIALLLICLSWEIAKFNMRRF